MTRPRALLAFLVIALAACSPTRQALTPGEEAWIHRWLTCNDCLNGELDSVRSIATAKPVVTREALSTALLAGPDTTGLRSRLAAAWDRDTAFVRRAGRQPRPYPFDSSYARTLRRIDRVYRLRAALALGWINRRETDAILDSARTTVTDSVALSFIKFARDSLPP